jgi:hypothetical protein
VTPASTLRQRSGGVGDGVEALVGEWYGKTVREEREGREDNGGDASEAGIDIGGG